MKYLIDSNIIIYYLNGEKIVQDFLEKNKSSCTLSLISYYEILNFNFTQEEESIIKDFLNSFEIIGISKNIIHQSLKNRKYKKIKMGDNFILSTSQLFGLTLVTRNTKDFDIFNIAICNPFKSLKEK